MNVSHGDSGSHWYLRDKDGTATPFYEVPYADPSKGMRKTTIKDARAAGAKPSVTTVKRIVANEAIMRYRIEQALLSALTAPIQKGEETDDQFVQRIIDGGKEDSEAAMDKGTQIHEAIELKLTGKEIAKELEPYVLPVVQLLDQEGIKIIKQEFSFCNELYGGRIDALGEKLESPPVLIDWKSQKTKKGKFAFYPDWGEQLAAYAHGIGKPEAVLANIVTSSTEPGCVDIKLWVDDYGRQMNDDLYQTFMLQYKLWCKRNNWVNE